jgi:ATP-dependent Clp protease adapter protein ClpS
MARSPREGSVVELEKQKVKPPPLYRVLLLNDD